ncbi:MAG: response regulator [Nitrospira sp.]
MRTLVPSPTSILLIEPKKSLALQFRDLFAMFVPTIPSPQVAYTLQEGSDFLSSCGVSLILLDLDLPDSTGPDAVRTLRVAAPQSAVIAFTESGSIDLRLEAIQAGAHELLHHIPPSPQELTLASQFALARVNSSTMPSGSTPSSFSFAYSPTSLQKLTHDLNNALTSINGFTDILLARLPEEEPPHRCAEQIKDACDRASLLSKELAGLSVDPSSS